MERHGPPAGNIQSMADLNACTRVAVEPNTPTAADMTKRWFLQNDAKTLRFGKKVDFPVQAEFERVEYLRHVDGPDGYSGLEKMAGVPGHVGGGIAMNAGGKDPDGTL